MRSVAVFHFREPSGLSMQSSGSARTLTATRPLAHLACLKIRHGNRKSIPVRMPSGTMMPRGQGHATSVEWADMRRVFAYRRQEVINSDQAFATTHQPRLCDASHMGPEFVEALTNRPATDTSRTTSQMPIAYKRLDRLAPFQHVTVLVCSRTLG